MLLGLSTIIGGTNPRAVITILLFMLATAWTAGSYDGVI